MITATEALKMTENSVLDDTKELAYINDVIRSNASNGMTSARVSLNPLLKTQVVDKLKDNGYTVSVLSNSTLITISWGENQE